MNYTGQELDAFKIHRTALSLGLRISMYHILNLSPKGVRILDTLLKKHLARQDAGTLTPLEFIRLFKIMPYQLDAFVSYYDSDQQTPACCAYKCLVRPNEVCEHGNGAFIGKLRDSLIYEGST